MLEEEIMASWVDADKGESAAAAEALAKETTKARKEPASANTAAQAQHQEWTQWVAANAIPATNFTALGIGESQVVGFGEPDHGIHECPQLRNDLFQYLAKEKKFQVFLFESGILEARLVERYVQGEDLNLEDVLRQGITHSMGMYQEQKDLVVWMRAFNNGKEESERVHFAGVDLPVVGDAPVLPLRELQQYLSTCRSTVNIDASLLPLNLLELAEKQYVVTRTVRSATKAYVCTRFPDKNQDEIEIDPDLLDCFGTIGFDQLTSEEQTTLEDGLATLATSLDAASESLINATSMNEYGWHRHLVDIASSHVRNLRSRQKHRKLFMFDKAVGMLSQAGIAADSLVLHPEYQMDMTNADDFRTQLRGRSTRERMAAENITWATKLYGKAFVYQHHGHLMKIGMDSKVGDVVIRKTSAGGLTQLTQGQMIQEEFGDTYFLIACSYGEMRKKHDDDDDDDDGGSRNKLLERHGIPIETVAEVESCVEKAFVGLQGCSSSSSSSSSWYINLRHLEGPGRSWLNENRNFRWQSGFQSFNVLKAFDAVLYFDAETPGLKI